jgi:small acid-soluble spore protein E (minor gamma-type SASP)
MTSSLKLKQFFTEFNQQPNKTSAGTNIQEVRQQNSQSASGQGSQGQFGTEFASETNAAEVRKQNQQSAQNSQSGSAQSSQGSQGQFGTEFASQTDAQEVRQQNQQSQLFNSHSFSACIYQSPLPPLLIQEFSEFLVAFPNSTQLEPISIPNPYSF